MAKRQDSGSSSAHQNQRPNAHNEDSIPEMTEDTRNLSEEGEDDEFEDTEDLDVEEDDEENI
jgi:hypothetical protein